MARNEAPSSKRDRIFRRDRHTCVYCGVAYRAEELTLDHVQPKMRGGDDSEGNLVTCCRGCNRAKAGQAAWQYLSGRPEARTVFLAAVEGCDAAQAKPVWSRLLRAIREAVD